VTVVTRVLNGCSNGAINIGFARLLGSIAATRDAEWLYSRREYRGNGNSLAGIAAGRVSLFVRTITELDNWTITYH